MPTRERAVGLLLLTLAGSCASNPTPTDRRVTQEEAISSGKGAYAFVRYVGRGSVDGELIASRNERVTLLTELGHLVDVPFGEIRELTLGVHDNNLGAMVLWGVTGSVSTISHGAFLIFTLPVWLITSISAGSAESYRGLFFCSESSRGERASLEGCLRVAGAYARFPQGLPPSVGAEQLLGRAPVLAPAPPAVAPPPAPDGGAPEAPQPYEPPPA
jgi:hypothetical protein